MNLLTLLAALAVAVAAGPAINLFLFIRAAWRWADQDALARRRIVRHLLLGGLVFSVPVAIVALLAGAAVNHPAAPVVAGGLVVVAIGLWLDRSTRTIDAIQRQARDLEDPAMEQHAVDQIMALAEATKPDDPMGKSVRVCAAVALGNASRDREALELLEPVRPEGLSDHERELYWLQKLDGLIVTGRLPAARKVLAAVPHLAEGGQHARVLRFLEARLLLWEGKPREALELVAGPEERRGDKRSQQAIRAHAYAALGDDERCLEALAWLDREFGERGLRRLLDPVGPATPHVEAWLRGKRGPYR